MTILVIWAALNCMIQPAACGLSTSSLSTARIYHTATVLPNGKVLVAGGLGSDYLSSAEVYDPASGMWTSTGSPLRHAATIVLRWFPMAWC